MKAGEYGISLAKSYGAAVISLYVIDDTAVRSLERVAGQDAQTLRRKLHKEGETCLHSLHRRASEKGVELTEVVKEGLPHRVIVDLAQEEGVDLIVIGKVGQRVPFLVHSVSAFGAPFLPHRSEGDEVLYSSLLPKGWDLSHSLRLNGVTQQLYSSAFPSSTKLREYRMFLLLT